MRALTFAVPALIILTAAGCASTSGRNTYTAELDRLTADCTARGGILAPTGQQTGRPQTDNVCKITGSASRLSRN